MKSKRAVFDTSSEVTKKKHIRDIDAEPEMVELKRMIRDGELDAARTVTTVREGLNLKKGVTSAMTELLTSREAASFLKVSVITMAKWRGKKADPRILAPAGPSSIPVRHWKTT